MEVAFGKQSYESRSKPFSAQRCVNCYVETAKDQARGQFLLQGTEGLAEEYDLGGASVDGLEMFQGVVYAVANGKLWQVPNGGTPTAVGTITGTGRADMAHSAVELAIVRDGKAWMWNGTTLSQVTDPDFPGAASVIYVDTFFVFQQPNGQIFFKSGSLDGLDYDGTEFASAEAQPDDLLRVFEDHRELLLFGTKTTEIWYNSGNADFPFERSPDAFIERGLAAQWAVTKADNTVYWLGDDLLFYRMQGYTPQSISTDGIANVVHDLDSPETCFAFEYTYDMHKFVVFTFPDDNLTLVYDIATSAWHERSSWSLGLWRPNCYISAYNKHLVGDIASGKIYRLDDEVYTDAGDPIERLSASPPIHGGVGRLAASRFELVFERGVGLTTGQGSDPQIVLDWSDDGGRTFGNEHWRTLGKIGEYERRAVWHRLGEFRSRIFRIRMTDPVKFGLMVADLEAQERAR